MTEA
jgi:splicing factor U2AF subunit